MKFKDMSTAGRTLLIMSVFQIVLAALFLFIGTCVISDGIAALDGIEEYYAGNLPFITPSAGATYGIALVILSAVEVLAGLVGILAAKSPSKAKAAIALFGLIIIVGIVAAISNIAGGTFTTQSLYTYLTPLICLASALVYSKENA